MMLGDEHDSRTAPGACNHSDIVRLSVPLQNAAAQAGNIANTPPSNARFIDASTLAVVFGSEDTVQLYSIIAASRGDDAAPQVTLKHSLRVPLSDAEVRHQGARPHPHTIGLSDAQVCGASGARVCVSDVAFSYGASPLQVR